MLRLCYDLGGIPVTWKLLIVSRLLTPNGQSVLGKTQESGIPGETTPVRTASICYLFSLVHLLRGKTEFHVEFSWARGVKLEKFTEFCRASGS